MNTHPTSLGLALHRFRRAVIATAAALLMINPQGRRGGLTSLDDSQPHELRQDTGRLGKADAGQTSDSGGVQLSGGLREDREDPPLGAGDDGLDRSAEAHGEGWHRIAH